MKRLIAIFTASLLTAFVFAQSPEKMSYQAIIRNSSGYLVTNQTVGMRISILQNSPSGINIYEETQTTTTNTNGLATIEIGTGTFISGTFSTIDWANGSYFIKIETDPSGGNNYTISGTSQQLSVPFALYAKTSGSPIGPQGEAGSNGTNGQDGLSAYQIWLNAGNTGTESEFITSLQGATGPQGPAGTSGFSHFIGEQFGGGVVFHLWRDSSGVEHGLIASLSNSGSKNWSNVVSSLIGAGAQSWEGLSNSIAVISQAGHISSAAQLCLSSTANGQTDWYLPSLNELVFLWQNRFDVNKTLSVISGASTVLNNRFWSSTESSNSNAWVIDFSTGITLTSQGKNTPAIIRAIRSF